MAKYYCQKCDEDFEFSDDSDGKTYAKEFLDTFHHGHLVSRKVSTSDTKVLKMLAIIF
jgi:hypothetical protein